MIGETDEIDLIGRAGDKDFLPVDDDDDPKPLNNFFVGTVGGGVCVADLLNGLVKLLNLLACSVCTVPPSSSNSRTKGSLEEDLVVVPSLPRALPCLLENFIASYLNYYFHLLGPIMPHFIVQSSPCWSVGQQLWPPRLFLCFV